MYGGVWVDNEENASHFTDCYFDHGSGEGAVQIVGNFSRRFPEVTFRLFVDGSVSEGYQGTVIIRDGKVKDGRNGFTSYGDFQEPLCERCHPQAFKPEDLLPIDRDVPEGRVECPKCHALYEYVNRKNVKRGLETIDLSDWYEVYEIPWQPISIRFQRELRRLRYLSLRLLSPLRRFIGNIKGQLRQRRFAKSVEGSLWQQHCKSTERRQQSMAPTSR